MQVRLGQILIEQGVITQRQVDQIIAEQQHTGQPFGLICERMFGIHPEAIEKAWATQYASQSRLVDPTIEPVEERAMSLVTRRQAWQFRVVPLRFDGRELMMATTQRHLQRALRFATAVMGVPVYLVMASPQALGEALCRYYPLPGLAPESVNDDGMDRVLA